MTLDLSAFKPTVGSTSDANAVTNAFTAIEAAVNANTAAIAGFSGGTTVPPGAMFEYAGTAAPTGWLLCDGSTVSRTTYAALFAVVSTTYNTGGEAGTDFRLPDLRGRMPVGKGTNASVSVLATSDGQAVANRRPQHRTSDSKALTGTVGFSDPTHIHGLSLDSGTSGVSFNIAVDRLQAPYHDVFGTFDFSQMGYASTGIVVNNGTLAVGGTVGTANGNDALDTPSFLVVNFIIKT